MKKTIHVGYLGTQCGIQVDRKSEVHDWRKSTCLNCLKHLRKSWEECLIAAIRNFRPWDRQRLKDLTSELLEINELIRSL